MKLFTGNAQEDLKTLRLKIERLTDWSGEYSIHDYDAKSPYIDLFERLNGSDDKDKDASRNLYELCMNIVQLPGKFNRTKLLIVAPKYLIMNNTEFAFTANQIPQSTELLAKIPSQSVTPLHWSFANKTKNIFLKAEKQGFRWSAPFETEKAKALTLKLKNMIDSESIIVHIEVSILLCITKININ